MRVELPAYAKINLGLRILGKRPDGYHEVCTLLQQIDLADTLELEIGSAGGPVELDCVGAALPCDEGNLVLRAARRLQELAGEDVPATRIRLRKRIPIGGGLGGGSSDAAVTLCALDHLWGLFLPEEQLHAVAASLGADVPFFLRGGMALATGIGEVLEPAEPWEDPTGLLAIPEVRVDTAWAYSQVKIGLTNSGRCDKFRSFLGLRPPLSEWSRWLDNDLEAAVFPSFPQLVALRGMIERAGASLARMSGSGSCLYGLFPTEDEARRAERQLEGKTTAQLFRFTRWGRREIIARLAAG